MSLWDLVAAASIGTNIREPDSTLAKVLKKINSATLSVLNGDSVNYVSGGGRTSNTFGASTNFTCDMEALLEGIVAGKFKADPLSGKSMLFGFLLLGPGAENKLLMGNATVLTYMPHHSSNFSVYRGSGPESYSYATWNEAYFCIKLSSVLFALVVFGYELLYSLAGSCFQKQILSPIGDSKYIATQEAKIHAKEKEKASLEAEEKKQEEAQHQREASGDVPSPEQQEAQKKESASVNKNIHDSENKKNELESSLKKAELEKELFLYFNVILENRGMYLLKILEKLSASVKKAQLAVAKTQNTVDTLNTKLQTTSDNITTKTAALAAANTNGSDQTVLDALKKEIDSLKTIETETETQLQAATVELENAQKALAQLPMKP